MVMKISIIVPVYDAAKWLPLCLDSCLAQTHGDVEVVCVDDGSTDGSGAILDEYAAKSAAFKVIHQPNGGVVAARKTAMEAATGEFCYFLDSDDWLPETALADLVAVVDDDTDIAFGDQLVVRSDGERVRTVLPGDEWRGQEYVNESLRHVNGCIGGKMFRTSLCRRLDIDETMRLNEDLLMNIQAGAMARKARRIGKMNYCYNWAHEGSLSKSQSIESQTSVIDANRRIADVLGKDDRLGFVLSDGYVTYLQRNIMTLCNAPMIAPCCRFLSGEARKALCRAPVRYVKGVVTQGFWGWVLLVAPIGMSPARRLYRFALKARKSIH